MQKEHQDPEVREGRDLGRGMLDRGAFEIDISSGTMEWANEFSLATIGCTIEQVTSMSVFDLSPERFHERIREDIAESEKVRPFYILPTSMMDGRIAWWYVFKTKAAGTRRWAYAEHIQNTPQSGPEFSFMSMQADMVDSQASVEIRMDGLESWIQEQMRQVEEDVSSLRGQLAEVRRGLEKAELAALQAAADSVAAKNASLATQQEIKKYATKEEMNVHFEKFDHFEEASTRTSAEILRLIKSDNDQKIRAQAYEDHVKKTTESAIKVIEAQATKSGKGLSRKVTIPLFVITTLAMVIQYLLQRWNVHILP